MPIIEPKRKSGTLPEGNLGNLFASVAANRMKTASDVVVRLKEYAPKRAPERPVLIEKSDGELHDLMIRSERGQKISKADRETLRLLGNWRSAVRNVEMVSCGNLILLLGVLNMLESDDSTLAEAVKVRRFLEDEYGAHLPGPPAPSANSNWSEWWASRNSQQRDILPLSLRTTADAKVGLNISKPVTTEEEEDDGY